MQTRRYLAFYLSSLAFGLSFGSALSAHSWYTRQHGSACRVAIGPPTNLIEWGNDSTGNSLVLGCAVPDNSLAPKENTGTLVVAVDDFSGGNAVSAFRCVELYNADGGTCGVSEMSCKSDNPLCLAGKGLDFIKTPNDSVFSTDNGAHFAYVGIVLPPKEAGARSKVKGIFNTDEVQ